MTGEDTARDPSDLRVVKAVRLMKRTTGLMVPEAMRAVGFTAEDAKSRRKRMWIHRRLNKKNENKPAASVIVRSDGESRQ